MTMMRIAALAALLMFGFVGTGQCSGGLFSALRDKVRKQDPEPTTAQQAPQVPPPAEQAGRPAQKTPTPEEIKAGASKIKQQMNWDSVPSDLFKRYEG